MLNRFQKALLLIISALVFIGCGYKEPDILIEKEKEVIYIDPPKEAYEQINIPTPISKEKYLSLNIKDKEKELGIYTTKLLTIIKIENMKKEQLKKYIDELKKNKK